MIEFGHQFEYLNKFSLEDFNVLMVKIEEEPSCPIGLKRTVIGTELSVSKPYIQAYTTKYDEVLSFPITICHPDGEYFTRQEVSDITAWLTSPKTHQLLKVFEQCDDNDTDYVEYMALFTDIEAQVVAGEVAGLKCTVSCNAPYGYSPEITVKGVVDNGSLTIDVLNNTTELGEYIYPLLSITPDNSTETITITNITDGNNSVVYKHVNKFTQINIDSLKEMVTDENGDLISFASLGWNDPPEELYLGDINGDNSIDYRDLVLLRRHVTEGVTLTEDEQKRADMNGDGVLDVVDIELLRQLIKNPTTKNYMNDRLLTYWLRLVPKLNKIKIDGNCEVVIKYRYPRKVGAV